MLQFNSLRHSDAICHHRSRLLLVPAMGWHLCGTKPLPEPIVVLSVGPSGTNLREI